MIAALHGKTSRDLAAAFRPPASDSADLLTSLRRAQRRLERVRRRHMRTVLSRGGACDEIIGRFCLWHEPEETWEPPPEAAELARSRHEFLAELSAAGARLPGDAWVAGQRVRYLQESGRDADALEAARRCRSPDPGWCRALAGFALHGAGRYREADSAFDRALREMPDPTRCGWSDVSDLLDRRARRAYRGMECAERVAFEKRLWWLADPLYMTAGNERRTEHLWRRVMDRLQKDAASGYGTGWGEDLRELLIRYGWPAGWEKVRPRAGSLASGGRSTVAHDFPGSRRFVPPGRVLEDPAGVGPGEWELDPRRPRSHYAPAYATEFGALEVDIARFRRGDTAVVVAIPAVSATAGPGCDREEVGLFLGAGPESTVGTVWEAPTAGPAVGRRVALADGVERGLVVSVETLCRSERRAGRARFGLRVPAGEPGISDLLLGREAAGGAPPAGLEEMTRRARPPGPLLPGERVPLYWEVYGARGTEATSVTVELVGRGGGLFRTLVGWTGLLGERPALVGMRWADRRPAPGVWGRSVVLRVPEDAPEGRYELRVTVRLDGGLPLRASRPVRVGT